MALKRFRFLAVAASLSTVTACAESGAGEGHQSTGEAVSRSIIEVQEAHTPVWMEIPGVVGTGIGQCDGVPCIKVFVAQKTPEIDRQIPAQVEGHPVRVEVTGPFKALDSDSG
jgi:predicted small secreted protein